MCQIEGEDWNAVDVDGGYEGEGVEVQAGRAGDKEGEPNEIGQSGERLSGIEEEAA